MATSSTSLWGAMGRGQGKLRESWNGLCVGAWAVGLWEGPLNAPGLENPLYHWPVPQARAQLGKGCWHGDSRLPLPPTPEAAFTLKYPSI